jgi:glycosyltransferase involved in cell wall biosynthesis
MKGEKNSVCLLRSTGINPDPRAMKTAVWLHKAGYNVRIMGWDRYGDSPKKEMINGIKIERIHIPSSYGSGVKNIFRLFLFNLYLIWYVFKYKPDVVHACDLDTALPAILMKMIRKTKVVYDIYDFYAESRRIGKLESFVRRLEKWVVRKSDIVILAHERRVEQLGTLSDMEKRKIITIYNTPEDIKIELDNKKLPDYPYFSYVGVLAEDRGIPALLDAVEEMNETGLVVAGFGPLENTIRSRVTSHDKVSFLGKISYEDALQIQGHSVAVVALYDPAVPNNRYAAPNKLYESAMLGKPVITSEGTLFSEVVRKEGIGYVVPYGDVNLLRQACYKIIRNPKQREIMGTRARRIYEQSYSAENMRRVLAEAYQKLNIDSW